MLVAEAGEAIAMPMASRIAFRTIAPQVAEDPGLETREPVAEPADLDEAGVLRHGLPDEGRQRRQREHQAGHAEPESRRDAREAAACDEPHAEHADRRDGEHRGEAEGAQQAGGERSAERAAGIRDGAASSGRDRPGRRSRARAR